MTMQRQNNLLVDSNQYPPRAQKFMSAALRLLSEHDAGNITNKEIAKEADSNAGLIYYYFESQAHLFRSSIEFLINQTLFEYQQLTQAYDDPVEVIQAWFSLNVKYSDAIRQLLKATMNYNEFDGEFSIQDLVEKFYKHEERNILATAIANGIETGLFQKVDATQIAHFISIQLDGIMCSSYIRKTIDIERELRSTESVLWHILGFAPKSE